MDKYQKTNDVNLESMVLLSDQGGIIDVSKLVTRVDLFEDIYSHFMTGLIMVNDGVGIRTHLPIMGTESFELSYRTPGFGQPMLKVRMNIVSITKREISKNNSSEVYELKLKSPSYLINEATRVQGAYSGKISDIVKRILVKYLPGSKYIIQPTKNDYKFTIPNMKITEVMDMLCKHAVSEEGDPNYLFYENVGGFIFRSIGDMSKQPTAKKYHNKLASINDGTDKVKQEFMKIQDIQIESDFDIEKSISVGALSSKLITHDITTKTINTSFFNYITSFNEFNHINENKRFPSTSKFSKLLDGFNIVLPKSTLNHGEMFDRNQNYEDFVQSGISTRNMFLNDTVMVRVSGDSRLRAGMVAELSMPATEPKSGSNDPNYENKYSSGRYLITSIRHHFINMGTKEYTNVIEMSRDSLPMAIPDVKKFDNPSGIEDGTVN